MAKKKDDEMKVVKKEAVEKKEIVSRVKSLSKFQGHAMALIEGNFKGGGFNISKNKLKAIFENEAFLKRFTKGEFDKKIADLKDDEVIML